MKVSKLCKKKGITQEKLAEDLGVDDRTVRRWEKKISTPRTALQLARYFDVPYSELFDSPDEVPYFQIGTSGSIDFEHLAAETMHSISLSLKNNISYDMYRKAFVKSTEEMRQDCLALSVKTTNLFSKVLFILRSKNWIELIGTPNVNDEVRMRMLAIDLFNPDYGILKNSEITALQEEMCKTCSKYKPNPLYELLLPTDIGSLLINAFMNCPNARTTKVQQYVVCHMIFNFFLGIVGEDQTEEPLI